MEGFLGTGMIVDDLNHCGTWHCFKLALKMLVKTGASWLAQCFNVAEDIPSGPDALRQFWRRKSFSASQVAIDRGLALVGGK